MAPKRKASAPKEAAAKKSKQAAAPAAPATAAVAPGAVVIEHCRAAELEGIVKESVPGAVFVINPDKPRKGTFEVRREGVVYESLQAMPRPFAKLRNLDLEALAAKVAADLK
ncbi:hypothetical protein CHLNCDRAFT_140940 [Chlorella variabilis]|uniref:Selenoprotein H n=1 Tax=Chlorella variabilis TaxID=554065 RepID=E1Z6K1_CHLVA|nr:hypothetical protein CHLNCDRAFT_140940 [Chlorella variabilis]EFN58945.1 hypothetical protein CHLNCDRAFT_140940 [Chlorella variabilis]|eukprot:XP_005851047.1 hypothetical protein CHLNCDRAFT_140940 [Chlorella variabilis]